MRSRARTERLTGPQRDPAQVRAWRRFGIAFWCATAVALISIFVVAPMLTSYILTGRDFVILAVVAVAVAAVVLKLIVPPVPFEVLVIATILSAGLACLLAWVIVIALVARSLE